MNKHLPSIRDLNQINDYLWEIPQGFWSAMKVPARLYADKEMLAKTLEDRSLEQLVNVATLSGIVKYALAMPDIHEGYGFPIGGVAGLDVRQGVISPGGVGYDINCGVRLLRSDLTFDQIENQLENLINQLQRSVPSGVGRGGQIKLKDDSIKKILERGVGWLIEQGYGEKEDLDYCEENGAMAGADSSAVSPRARNRGRNQLGTLGAGNHFLEIQKVDQIFDQASAQVFGLFEKQLTIMIHSGSRGLGHQVCTDYVKIMHGLLAKYRLKLPDPELACLPFNSPEGQQYFRAMAGAANFAWANRQMLMDLVRKTWQKVLGQSAGSLTLVYDLAHNIAKQEEHFGQNLIVHRKGATRAFPPGHQEIPQKHQAIGQAVLIPGTMGTASYVLTGTSKAQESFFSVCHGAGRLMSRHAALRQIQGADLRKQLSREGILVRCFSNRSLAEEAPLAYKDVNNVVQIAVGAGLVKKVARLRPLAVIKG